MGRLCVAAAECNYREIDRQHKEHFIYRLNDKVMLDEMIRELTAKSNDEPMTSEGVLAWAKRVEAQRAQVAIMNNITESHQFDRIKMAQKPKSSQDRQQTQHLTNSHADTAVGSTCPDSAQHMGRDMLDVGRWATSRMCAGARWTARCMK